MHRGGPGIQRADAVICGAGIVGIAVAHALAARNGWRHVMLVDEGAPLSLTSDKSSEAYRNWWPGPDEAMVLLMNRSIDLLEAWAAACGNRFHLNRRGYLYTTADPARAALFESEAARASAQGAGPLRVHRSENDAQRYTPSAHRGYLNHPDGADLFLDRAAIRRCFPWLNPDTRAVLHARRCGWFSGQQFGMHLLEQARAAGVTCTTARVVAVERARGEVAEVHLCNAAGEEARVSTSVFVNAAGPHARAVGRMTGYDLPLFLEAHYKVALEDVRGVIDRNTGLVILNDAQRLAWSAEEREALAANEATRCFTDLMPAGVHFRPEGYGDAKTVLMLWDIHRDSRIDEPVYPLPDDPYLREIVLRGAMKLVPQLSAYLERLPPMYVDGGYYTKTVENRPLIGPAGPRGAFVCAGFSGFGLMAAAAAAELLAGQITGEELPSYGAAFRPDRYEDPAYRERLVSWGSTGQL